MPDDFINTGVILGSRENDWESGKVGSSIIYEVLNESGDWTQWLPSEEWQRNHIVDTSACVTFSALNCLEILHYFLTGKKINFSDRYTAKCSGTSEQGNYLFKVADSIRHDGLVLEEEWPTPENYTWDAYYDTIPVEVLDKGKRFLDEWEIHSEQIPSDRASLLHHIKQSPLQVVIPGHAITNFYNPDSIYKYFDHYDPFIKQNTEGFIYSYKYTLTKKTLMVTLEILEKLYQLGFKRALDEGAASHVGKPLDEVLNALINSEENRIYTPLFKSAKDIENWARGVN